MAVDWADERLAAARIERTGDVEQPHLRPWSTLLRIPTGEGPVWLKACGGGTAFEAGLYEVLARVAPDRVLAPLAVDTERAWILLPDGGASLGERLEGEELLDALEVALPRYAQLQLDLAPHLEEVLEAGVDDMRPAALPGRFEEALDAARGYARSDARVIERIEAFRETYREMCDELAQSPLAPSVDHNDMHPGNVLGDLTRTRFYDWGDAVVAHPFASMLVALQFVPRDSGRFERVRDAYLEAFTASARRPDLVATLELSCRVAKVARALTWQRAVSQMREGDDDPRDFRGAPYETMKSLLEADWLASA